MKRPDFVKVGVVFEVDGFKPVWFYLGRTKIVIDEVTYYWTDRHAEELLHKFSVRGGKEYYQLVYNSRRNRWILEQAAIV